MKIKDIKENYKTYGQDSFGGRNMFTVWRRKM